MTRLIRTSEVTKLPVVTLVGEDIAQVKDIVYAADGGAVAGFTLAGRGMFSGPLKQALLWTKVLGLGRDAVVIADADALEPVDAVHVVAAATGSSAGSSAGGRVLGSRVLTESGTDLGEVVDVIVQFASEGSAGEGHCDVIGYEIEASESLASRSSQGTGTRMLVPLPDTLAVSGEHLMVPPGAEQFISQDLAGFGAAVAAFRAQLEEGTA